MSVILERRWHTDHVLQLVAGLMLCLSATSLIGILAHRLLPSSQLENPFLLDFLLGTICFHGSSLILVHIFLRRHELRWKDFIGWTHPQRRRAILLGLIGGVAVLLPALGMKWVSGWLLTWSQMPYAEQQPIVILKGSTRWSEYALFGVAAVVVAPLLEEILFRGILYGFLKQRGYPLLALALSSLLFAVIHLNLVTLLSLLFLAVCLIWLYERSDSLLAPILTHALFNAINFVFIFLEA